jgi:hypothetical protein
LPANQFAELRRELNDSTKAAWIRKLNEKPQPSASLEGKFCCLDHNNPLVKGMLPNYGFEGLLPACCDLQHVQPPIMAKVLEMGLGAPSGASMGGSKRISSQKQNSMLLLTRILVGSVMGLITVYLAGNYGLSAAGIFLGLFLLAILMGKFAFYFWEKRQKSTGDGLDRLQYEFKFKEALGEWIEAS